MKISRALVLLACAVSALWATPALAQSCGAKHKLSFADGQSGCLTDYGLFSQSSAGRSGKVTDAVPVTEMYSIAVPRDLQACPKVVGFFTNGLTMYTSGAGEAQAALDERRAQAVKACNASVDRASPGNASQCGCALVVVDGRSPLTRPAFDALVAGGRTDVGVAVATPVAQRVLPEVFGALFSGGSRATSAPTPEPARPSTDSRAAADLAAMRQQLDAQRAQIEQLSRAQAPAAPAIAAAAAATVPAVAPARKLTAHALVIGNSAYAYFGRLPNPRNDATAIAQKLRSYGISVDLVLDADRGGLVKALNDYQSRATGKDVNILYYAGHGVQAGGVNFIIPVDMRADGITAGYIKLNGVALNDALDYLPAPTRLVFLDACRENAAARSLMATRGAGGVGLAPVNVASGTLISYATKEGSVAEDGNGVNSPYTQAMLQHLDGAQDIAIVMRRVRQSVMQATSARQEPWEYGSLVGDQLVLSQMFR